MNISQADFNELLMYAYIGKGALVISFVIIIALLAIVCTPSGTGPK